MPNSGAPRKNAKGEDLCSVCGEQVTIGEPAYWDPALNEVWHDRHGPDGARGYLPKNRRGLVNELGMP